MSLSTLDSNPNQEMGQSHKPTKDGATPDTDGAINSIDTTKVNLPVTEEEEEGECEFCVFMKKGGCKEEFTLFEECIDEAEKKEIEDVCVEVTEKLIKCMEAHHEYYKHYFLAKKAKEAEMAAKAKAKAESKVAG